MLEIYFSKHEIDESRGKMYSFDEDVGIVCRLIQFSIINLRRMRDEIK